MKGGGASGQWPRSADAISKEWLSEVLSQDLDSEIAVGSFAISRVGTGQVGECWRTVLDLDEAAGGCVPQGAPGSVIVKLAASDAVSRAAGRSQSCYLREVGFYRDLQASVRIRTPHCYFSAIAPNQTDHVLVLEDMHPARQGDQLAGCAPDVAAAVLEQLALLHGPLWGDEQLLKIDWLEVPTEATDLEVLNLFAALYPAFLERFEGRLSEEATEVVGWLGRHLASLVACQKPLCPVHNDYRLDNMLLGDGDSAPLVTVVDWQTVKLGPGPRDAAYFLGAGLKSEDRREHERSLVESVYYRTLLDEGVTGFSFDQCWLEYRRGALGGVIMAVIGSMLVGVTERGDEMFLTMARRHARHSLDVDAMGAVG